MKHDMQQTCTTLYILYAVSALMQFFEPTLLAGLVTLIAAYFYGQSKRKAAEGTAYASHLRWLYRTFWIASLILLPAGVVTATALIFAFTDIGSLATAAGVEDPSALAKSIQVYMDENMGKVSLITLCATAPVTIWWLNRCWRGYSLAKEGRPLENVTRWL
jgi:uncharacterized membrane protein